MEDDKTPASPRKRAAKAKPNDPSDASTAADSTVARAGKTPRPRKIPPATFVSPAAPSQPTAPSQPAPPSQPASDAPAAASPAAAAPTGRAAKAPAKKIAKRAAPKAAALKKTTPAAAATSGVPPQKVAEPPAPVEPAAAAAVPAPAPPAPLWPAIKASPGYATELLALATVEHLGTQARADLAWLRDTYPTATTPGLARIATSRSVRQARTQGAVAGLLGPLAVLAETGALLWTQARLVLDLAATYGRDPAEPERAVELLMLLRVHPDLTAARAAVRAARAVAANGAGAREDMRVTLSLVRLAGRALGRMTIARRAARLVPGAGAVLTGILDGRATEQLAVRATKFYRG